MKLPIYLDNNATTRTDPRVLEAMLPYFVEIFGNAASRSHSFGWEAETAVESAREKLATAIGADPTEIVFTSGATESDNLAIKGIAEAYRSKGEHIITAATEHKAVLDTCKGVERYGYRVTYLPVSPEGFIDLDALRDAITDRTILVSIMHGNNEIGTIQDVGSIGAICRERGVLFHTDATQTLGKVPFDVEEMMVDLASFSAHKLYGPKGCGALYVRRRNPRVRLAAQMEGGGHERGFRSGTLNVPGIVGFGRAIEIATGEMPQEIVRVRALRDRLWNGLRTGLGRVHPNGPDPIEQPERRLPGNLNAAFDFIEADALMMEVREIALSSGSACTSASIEPSHVLRALGIGEERAHGSIRFGIGRFTTGEEIDYAIERITAAVRKLRELSPRYGMREAVSGR
jgi:cysteine desulfurase